jgi:hypothetical protein
MALQIEALWLRKTVQRLGSKEISIQLFVIHSDTVIPQTEPDFLFLSRTAPMDSALLSDR